MCVQQREGEPPSAAWRHSMREGRFLRGVGGCHLGWNDVSGFDVQVRGLEARLDEKTAEVLNTVYLFACNGNNRHVCKLAAGV